MYCESVNNHQYPVLLKLALEGSELTAPETSGMPVQPYGGVPSGLFEGCKGSVSRIPT